MRPSNNPDIALAQEWIADLDAWIEAHGLVGYDPFDVKQHPWIRAAQPYAILRKASTGLCDRFPHASRSLLHVQPSENPKAHALVALGKMRLCEVNDETSYLDHALEHLTWLAQRACSGYGGLCWGYPFAVSAKGLDTEAETPVGVVSAIAGQAFLRAYELTQKQQHLDAARSVAQFMLDDLPRMEQPDGTVCFGYTPGDRRRVHNANLLVAEHLFQVGAITQEPVLVDAAEPALRFSLTRQREDGAWYYGEYDVAEPFEEGILRLIDNHHTGFVLRSLHAISKVWPGEDVTAAIEKGFRYYRKLFTPSGMPVNDYGQYPVDIHACAEGILCASVLAESLFTARRLAFLAIRWPYFYLRNPDDGAPYYRKYPFFTARITFPRWGVAWMYLAVAEYLYRFYGKR